MFSQNLSIEFLENFPIFVHIVYWFDRFDEFYNTITSEVSTIYVKLILR